MKNINLSLLIVLLFCSCTFNKQLSYVDDEKFKSTINHPNNNQPIQVGDILKIEISSTVKEAAVSYNKASDFIGKNLNNQEIIKLMGYSVNENYEIHLPILGKLSVRNLTVTETEKIIANILIDNNHLIEPNVNVRLLNSKFTVLGEVKNPGTYTHYEQNINIFQAIGYAGDITIDGKKNNVTLIRHLNGASEKFNLDLTETDFLNSDQYYILNNDVIIINPSFNRVKSAGFVGSPNSIASISSIILSITLLLINN